MQTQFQYITELAKKYRQIANQPATFLKAINEIPLTIVEDIHKENGDPVYDDIPKILPIPLYEHKL